MEIMTCIGGSKKKKEKITDGNVDICRDTLNVSPNSFIKQDARSASLQNYHGELFLLGDLCR